MKLDTVKAGTRSASVFFMIQLWQYFMLTVNFRAVAQGRMLWTFITDLAIACVSFFILKKVQESKTRWEWAGYTLGGAFGSVLAIYLTKMIFGA